MPFSMPPGLRLPYDTDGTVVVVKESIAFGNDVLDVHPDAVRALNSDRGIGVRAQSLFGTDPDAYWAFLFPVPTRIRGIFVLNTAGGPPYGGTLRVEGSKNSTNSVDGNWDVLGTASRGNAPGSLSSYATADGFANPFTGIQTALTSSTEDATVPALYYRNLFNEVGNGIIEFSGAAARNLKALRVVMQSDSIGRDGMWIIHLYGEPDTLAEGEDFVQAWRADSDMRLGGASLSFGDVPLGSSADKPFRVKNRSVSKTANDVLIYVEDSFKYPSPSSIASQFLLSADGTTWTTTLTLGALGPDTVSPVLYLRKVTPTNAPLGSWSPKLRFDVGSWS